MTFLLGGPNKTDSATVTGTNWSSLNPVGNLSTRALSSVARSNVLANPATVLIDYGKPRATRVAALIGDNISIAGQYRVRGLATYTQDDTRTNYIRWSDTQGVGQPGGPNNTANITITGGIDDPFGGQDAFRYSLAADSGGANFLRLTLDSLPLDGTGEDVSVGFWARLVTLPAGLATGNPRCDVQDGAPIIQYVDQLVLNEWVYIEGTGNRTSPATLTFLDLINNVNTSGLADPLVIDFADIQVQKASSISPLIKTAGAAASRVAGEYVDYRAPLYDTGFIDRWGSTVPSELLEWEDDNFWDGKPLQEDIERFPQNLIHVVPAPIQARYWQIDLTDPSNPAGYIEAGRLFIGNAYQPPHSPRSGLRLGYETRTTVTTAIGGAEFFDRREGYRVARFDLPVLDRDEALAALLDLQREVGIDGEVLLVIDADDAQNLQRQSFRGRFRSLEPLVYIAAGYAEQTFEIKELQ
ncbi:MAG: hypothetical protein KI792_12665 [Alphaproteobacteria bacterium]|nr:hypothetical protein [Alphaproteobacteria bacterium SS10]